ncbi:protein maelstrom 1-like [Haematobia irritans]|uniref:protein maelstrom 1-like n=1 Tax=Haematobia irritans TaxID=7368 RepID=UPI003F4FC0B1
MPPKQKQKPNAFMIFTMEWKKKQGGNISLNDAIQQAGEIWKTMNAEERAPYKEKQKEELRLFYRNSGEKLSCTGMPISQIEKNKLDHENKERTMKQDIENAVRNSLQNKNLEKQSYYFIMANYFIKTLKGGAYVPAEIAICKFSLNEGVSDIYQTLINPEVNLYGNLYEAQHHADTTHNLPLPPSALGEKNRVNIYQDILNFIRNEDDASSDSYPPIFTDRECIEIIESVLKFLKTADVRASSVHLKIYPIQYLLFVMKEATCDAAELEKPLNCYITDAYFERDYFEYHTGIACQYHEDVDKCKYCTQSYVTRWAYMFCDYMCRDLDIPLEPGRHCPMNTNINAINTRESNNGNDKTSIISMGTSITYATAPICGSKSFHDKDDEKTATLSTDTDSKPYTSMLKGHINNVVTINQTTPNKISPTYDGYIRKDYRDCFDDTPSADEEDDVNPWDVRSREKYIPPEPESSCFDIDYTSSISDIEDYNSVASFGRDRTSLVSSLSSVSIGRGRLSRP